MIGIKENVQAPKGCHFASKMTGDRATGTLNRPSHFLARRARQAGGKHTRFLIARTTYEAVNSTYPRHVWCL